MKIFTIILLLLSIKVSGQTPNITTQFTPVFKIGHSDKNTPYVTIWSDSTVSLQGDTIEIIKMLMKKLNEKDKEYTDLYYVIGKGVQFLNIVPDIYKTGKPWNAYWSELRKLGYYKK